MSFVNPPYGREIGRWIKKGFEEWRKGKTVVFLIPSRTDTAWWHDHIMKASEIRYIRGRLKFGDAKNSAPFPSAIAIFRKEGDSPHTSPIPPSLEPPQLIGEAKLFKPLNP